MPCCAVLCCAVLCCAALCCAVLQCAAKLQCYGCALPACLLYIARQYKFAVAMRQITGTSSFHWRIHHAISQPAASQSGIYTPIPDACLIYLCHLIYVFHPQLLHLPALRGNYKKAFLAMPNSTGAPSIHCLGVSRAPTVHLVFLDSSKCIYHLCHRKALQSLHAT